MFEGAVYAIRPIGAGDMRDLAEEAGVNVAIEQTRVWYDFEETFPDRNLVGFFGLYADDQPIAAIALQSVKYHGTEFLWAKHGPVWFVEPTEDLEPQVAGVIVDWIRHRAPMAAFVRMHLEYPPESARPPVQMVTYDRTVVIDLDGGSEKILSRFSSKGRTNVRRSIRRNPVQVIDETALAMEDFGPYYLVMEETAQRQGFNAWGQDVYKNMINALGAEHVRIFAARSEEGELCGWSLVTISGTEAVYYYAASNALGRSLRSPEQLVFGSAVALGEEGLLQLDLMGIGSELTPSLDSLTSFKMKFTKEEAEVTPAWDLPVNKVVYFALITMRSGIRVLRDLKLRVRGKPNETSE